MMLKFKIYKNGQEIAFKKNAQLYDKNFQTLFIFHGLYGRGKNWQTFSKKLSKEENQIVVTVDLRNHGGNDFEEDITYMLMMNDIVSLFNYLGIENTNILGHSMGGKVAMSFACTYPERVRKLVVVDIAPKYYPPHHQEILSGLNAVKQAKIKSRKDADQILSQYFSESAMRQFLLKNLYWRSSTELTFKFNLKVLSDQIENVGQALHTNALYDKPTLFIVGQSSNYIKVSTY